MLCAILVFQMDEGKTQRNLEFCMQACFTYQIFLYLFITYLSKSFHLTDMKWIYIFYLTSRVKFQIESSQYKAAGGENIFNHGESPWSTLHSFCSQLYQNPELLPGH